MNFASFTLVELLTTRRAYDQLKITDPQTTLVNSLMMRLEEEYSTRLHRISNAMKHEPHLLDGQPQEEQR